MGVAETIPGVSGGTLALITGIYPRLIKAIHSIDAKAFSYLRKFEFQKLWQHIDGSFILKLVLGMVVGIGIGIFGISYWLEKMPPTVWAFFFGLIIASIFYVGAMIKKWRIQEILALVVGALVAFGLTQLPVGSVNDHLLFIFICGSIAISAMILPGISGSFLLLIMGMYQFILHDTLKEGLLENHELSALIIIAVFGLGCAFGLFSFSRIVNWALEKYEQLTLALLTGFIIGSMHKIWPWRWPKSGYAEDGSWITQPTQVEFDKIISELYLMPSKYEHISGQSAFLVPAILFFILGIAIVYFLSRSK